LKILNDVLFGKKLNQGFNLYFPKKVLIRTYAVLNITGKSTTNAEK
jgi:hypothetical protein